MTSAADVATALDDDLRNLWGLIRSDETCPFMGMDGGWFRRFMEAYFESLSAADLPIWRVVRWTRDDSRREQITDELPWEETWRIVENFEKDDTEHLYGCEHNVAY